MVHSPHLWIWSEPDWPALRIDGQHVAEARRAQSVAERKAFALGLLAHQDILADAWSQDALARAARGGERLNLPAVR